MQELSLNILDIAQNSVRADATLIGISVEADTVTDRLTITITDNGCGMSAETVAGVMDPFYTTRTTRKVGLGISFFRLAAQQTGGDLAVESELGKGTKVTAWFTLGHIDLAPVGDLEGTVTGLVQCNPDIDFVYTLRVDGETFVMDTREIRAILGEVSLAEPQVALFIREYLTENTQHMIPPEFHGGIIPK